MPTVKQDTITEGARALPAVGGATYSFIEPLPLNEIVGIVTILYICAQVYVLLHKHYWHIQDRKIKKGQNGKVKKKS